METISNLNRWANRHTNFFTDVLRVLFGAFLFYKGIYFLSEPNYLDELLRNVHSSGTYLTLVHYVALAHVCGGLFIMLGLLTRLCSLIQLPILLGAVIVNFVGVMEWSNFLQALITFLVCVGFTLYGSGRHSVDYSLKLHI